MKDMVCIRMYIKLEFKILTLYYPLKPVPIILQLSVIKFKTKMSYLKMLTGSAVASIGGLGFVVVHLYSRTEQMQFEIRQLKQQTNQNIKITHEFNDQNVVSLLKSYDKYMEEFIRKN